jgi:DNA-binding NarL/FixJ family response regulator
VDVTDAPAPAARREPTTAEPATVALTSAARLERHALRIRYVLAALVGTLAISHGARAPLIIGACGFLLLGVALYTQRLLPTLRTPQAVRRHGWRALALDTGLVLLTFGLVVPDPVATPAVLLVLLVASYALRDATAAVVIGLALFVVGLGGRALLQEHYLTDGALRPELLVLWSALALLMVAFARELRSQEHRHLAALAVREQLAQDLHATVASTLRRSGVPDGSATHAEVMTAVAAVVAGADADRDELVDRLSGLLSAPHRGLTPRELEILVLLGRGHGDARIAASLFISTSTVRNHVQNLRGKLDLATRDELRAYARTYAPPT